MRLGLSVGYSGATLSLPMEMIRRADRLGYHSVWTSEAYGSDAVSPLAWIGAQTERIHLGTSIMQVPARTPAMTAMTAMTLDQLSGGRMLLGLGLSGPQVAEGWHGQPYGKPLGRTREYVAIVRAILARQAPLLFSGEFYQVPYLGEDATGLGKPLKSILHGRADLPIYLAAIGPKNVELAAEIADGWMPIFYAPEFHEAVFGDAVRAGLARASAEGPAKSLAQFDIAPSVAVIPGDDVDACRNMVRPMLALYVGGMGAKGRNFYFDLVSRYGFGDVADQVQQLYLSGRKDEAAAAIPDGLVDAVALCGPPARIAEGLERWKSAPVNTLILTTYDPSAVDLMADLVLGADAGHPDRTWSLPTTPPAPAGATQKEPASVSDEPRSAAVFRRMAAHIEETPGLAEKVNASYRFNITGEPGGVWLVDLKTPPGAVVQESVEGQPVDCTITMADDDFVALASGALNAMAAFGQGKVQVQGNVMLAMKLQSLF
jgi:F420-dependent oxidoreductase-like protein